MSGLLSEIGSGVSGVATNFGNNIANQTQSFANSLNPFGNNGSIVQQMPNFPPVYGVDSPSSINKNYMVQLFGNDENNNTVNIMASLPEHFSFHLQADWQPLLHNPSITGIAASSFSALKDLSSLGTAIQKGLGVADYSQSATLQVYQSTTPIDFSIPFTFNAVYNPATEVMQPIQELASLVSPSSIANSTFLKIPGPNIFEMAQGKGYKISLRIGQAIMLPNVLVIGVSPMMDTMCDSAGYFISAQVDVIIRTTTILTKQDIAKMFSNLNQTSNASTNNSLPAGWRGV